MKKSSCSGGSLRSEHSNILSLSSNKSESFQVPQSSELQKLKQKLSNLFQVDQDNVEDLYNAIENKYSTKFVHETLTELNSILSNLGSIKKNNREMAKLVSSLGVKLQQKDKNKDHKYAQNDEKHKIEQIEHNKQCKYQKYPTITTEQSKNAQTNQTSTSYEEYHFEYQPAKPIFGPENPQFHATNSYREFQMNNKKHEHKIMEMLNELGNIKVELKSKKKIEPKPTTNKITYSEPQTKPYQPNNQPLNYIKKQELNHFKSQEHNQSKARQINHTKIYELNPLKNQQLIRQHSKQPKLIVHHPSMHSNMTQKSLTINEQNQKSLYIKANQISERLEQIKTKIQGIKTQQNQPLPTQTNSQLNHNANLKPESDRKKPTPKQKSARFESLSESSSSSNPISMGASQQNSLPVFERHVKKKSILDEMKNVESKMFISEKLITDKDTLIDVFNGTSFQENSNQNKSHLLTNENQKIPSEQNQMQKSSVKQVVISYANMSNIVSETPQNISFHNTSIMNPHQRTVNNPQNFPVERKEHAFENQSFIGQQRIVDLRKSSSHERLDNRSYSRERRVKFMQSQPSFPLIQEVIPVQRLGNSHSTLNISLKNLNNRLENPLRQDFPLYVQHQRHTHPLIPIPLNTQSFNPQASSPGFYITQSRMVNPFEGLNHSVSQQINQKTENSVNSMSRSSSFWNQNPGRNYETAGINLSVMKVGSESSLVTLGGQKRQMYDSTYLRDSRDSKKGKGLRLSNQLS